MLFGKSAMKYNCVDNKPMPLVVAQFSDNTLMNTMGHSVSGMLHAI
jgi:hypothetical protein